MPEKKFGIRDIVPNNIRDNVPNTKNSYFQMSSTMSLIPNSVSTALNLDRIPLIGFGTYAVKTPKVVYNALGVEYRHLDLAENYNNLQQGLEIEVDEMICLWEALFPDDQNYFQLHQIKDLVSSIPLHGSMLYAWSELLKNARKILLKKARKTPTGRYC